MRFFYLQVVQHEHYQHAGRGQPHLDRADRAQPRHHRRPQRRGAGAQLFGLYAGDHAEQGGEHRRADRRARHGGRDHAARPAPLQASCWRRARASKACRSAPASRTRRSRASPPTATAFPAWKSTRGCSASIRRANCSRTWSATSAASTSANSTSWKPTATDANYRGTDYIGKTGLEQSYETLPARHHRRRAGGSRCRRARGAHAVAHAAGVRQQPGAEPRCQTAGNRLPRVRRLSRRAGRDRSRPPAACSPSSASPASIPICSSTASIRRTGTSSTNSTDRPMVNRALAGTYPPGSTFKPYMALAALTYGKRTPQQTISDPGYFNFGGHTFRDDKVGGHGMVDMYKSIVVSCDTYYYMLANDLGIDNISRFMAQFGFGSRTGIDIDGESAGMLPSQEWKMRRFKQKWYAGETISVGIGQGYNAYTPLQLASGDRDAGQRRRDVPPAHRQLHRGHRHARTHHGRAASRCARSTSSPSISRWSSTRWSASTRRAPARAPSPAPPYVSAGKTGTAQVVAHQAGRKIRREPRRRAPPRPRAVHRLRAGRQAPRSRSRCWWKTPASARAPRRRSRARCSIIICSARQPTPLQGRGDRADDHGVIRRITRCADGAHRRACCSAAIAAADGGRADRASTAHRTQSLARVSAPDRSTCWWRWP